MREIKENYLNTIYSADEANTSSEAEHSSEEKNSKTEFLSEQGMAGEFQILPSLFPV